jgi:hypothetical protein
MAWATWVVPEMTTVTPGCAIRYFRKICGQLLAFR